MHQMLCPRLIGRDEECQAIEAALHAACMARGGSVFLLGEAGVGKSRLAREAERLAHSAGMRVLWGRSVEGPAAMAFRPISEALLSAVRRDAQVLVELPQLRPFRHILARLIPDWREEGAAPTGDDESLVLLSEAVLRLLRAIGSSTGCLLILEDLHWADSETLAVLEYLVPNASDECLLVFATCRLESPSAALGLARSFATHRTASVIELPRLRPDDIQNMASACLDDSAVPASVERLLTASAEGLPLLVEDLLAEWVGAGELVRISGGWEVRRAIGPVIPMSFGETVGRRLRALGSECSNLLQLAALLGRDFDWTLLPLASALDEERVLEQLHAAVDAQLLLVEQSGFRFRHALTREAVLDGVSPVLRARQASGLLALVEAEHVPLEGAWRNLAAALAETAGDRLKAATLLMDSGRHALALGALATAEAILVRARPLAESSPVRTEIDEQLLHVLSEAGKQEAVFALGDQLLGELQHGAATPVRVADVHLTIAQAAVPAARFAEARHHLERARRVDAAGVFEARIAAQAAHVAIDERRLADAEQLAGAALAAAERTGEMDVACEALIVLGRLARNDDLDRAEAEFERAHQVAEEHGLTVWRSRALHELGTIDMFRECSARRLLEARKLAEDSGALATVAAVDIELAAVYLVRFEMEQSVAAAHRALDASRRFRLHGITSTALLFAAEASALRMDRTGMERVLAQLPEASGEERLFLEYGRSAFRAEASLCEEKRAEALRFFDMAVRYIGQLAGGAPAPAWGERALLRALKYRDAVDTISKAVPASATVHPINRAYVHYASAICLGRLGQTDKAAEAVAAGDRAISQGPWYFHMARRLVAEAAIEDGWGDPARWLTESETFFDQHGVQPVASACRSLLRKCGARAPTPRARARVPEPFRAAGVTEREMEVLAVLPDGLSNKEIAARLYLSPKTVEKHVASLMDKLDMRSRAQLAAIAAAKMQGPGAH
jgi:DNA-binding CsgD family transcriptional regulator